SLPPGRCDDLPNRRQGDLGRIGRFHRRRATELLPWMGSRSARQHHRLSRATGAAETMSVTATLSMTPEPEHDAQRNQNSEHEQRDLDPALRVFALDRTGYAIHERLKCLGPEGIAQQPHRREDVLERLARVIRT